MAVLSRAYLLALVTIVGSAGCASAGSGRCGTPPCHDASEIDAGAGTDGGGAMPDAGPPDASMRDAGMPDPMGDTGPVDAHVVDVGASDAGHDAPVSTPDTGVLAPMRCPAGEALTGTSGGSIQCAPLGSSITSYVNQSCSIYMGWRDSCGGCTSEPTKWGRVSDASCETVGTDSTCQQTMLGAANVRLYGLNPDGDVDDNDRLSVGFRCDPAAAGGAPIGTACPAGQFVTGTDTAGAFTCAPVGSVAEGAVNGGCWLYLGWQDSCNGCTGAPTKWGRVHGDTCEVGAGAGNTCARATLGASSVMMFGIDFDGDVDDNDEIYLGLQCAGATASETMAIGACPGGTLATGTGTGGSLVCTAIAQIVETTVNTQCFAYLGLRDNCDACTTAPAKWGRIDGAGTCENGVGVSDVCISTPFPMFGANVDGDLNDDDKIYVGMHCF